MTPKLDTMSASKIAAKIISTMDTYRTPYDVEGALQAFGMASEILVERVRTDDSIDYEAFHQKWREAIDATQSIHRLIQQIYSLRNEAAKELLKGKQ